MLKENGISNATYLLFEKDPDRGHNSAYVQVLKRFSKNSLDFVLVDGMHRSAWANAVLDYIRPGGILIIDDANWYLPSNSVSPHSRTLAQGPASPQWAEFLTTVRHWRCIWTSNGVSDTAIYVKPCQEYEFTRASG